MAYRISNLQNAAKLLWPALILGTFMIANVPANAKSWVEASAEINTVNAVVVKDGNITLRSDTPFSEVRVAESSIADVVVLTNHSFLVTGKTRGKTSVMIYDNKKRLLDVINVEVNLDIQGLKKSLYETFPKERIEVRRMAGKIYLSGDVTTSRIAEQAEKIAAAYSSADDVTSGLIVRDSHQVMLEVRFVEATRSAIKELGVGLLVQQAGQFSFASGVGAIGGSSALSTLLQDTIGPTNIDVKIDALEESGVIRTLAEPNLISMSGETASFLAGGEFPIPITGRNGEVTITYRQFGVGLSFTPTVLDDGIINLKVSPEVSQLDPTNSVRVGGVEVPGLTIRRADTTVELRNSQSFAIAGLLQNTETNRKTQVPWLGDIPVLGSLFRSSRFKNNETELVIIVTPRLVQPVSDISQLSTPLDNNYSPSEAGFFLGGQMNGNAANRSPVAQNYGKALHGTSATKPGELKPAKTKASGGLSARYGHVIN
ncbi:MAG: type II and III secretion system protein family protein [Robiginitomaculum sp.]|nr:type II and III secretion system protein family protein [Robiginitomaculum sp.]